MKTLIPLMAGAALMAAWETAIAETVLNPPPASVAAALPAPASPAPASPTPAAPAPAVPVPPATPAATAAVAVLQNVCLPLLGGAKLEPLAKQAGLKDKDGEWVLPIDRERRVELSPPDAQNPRICSETITHRQGAGPAIFGAVDHWAKSQTPALQPVKVESQSKASDYLWLISSWSGRTPKGSVGVVLTDQKPLAGQSSGGVTQSTLMVTLTPS